MGFGGEPFNVVIAVAITDNRLAVTEVQDFTLAREDFDKVVTRIGCLRESSVNLQHDLHTIQSVWLAHDVCQMG